MQLSQWNSLFRDHIVAFLYAYDFAKRPKTLNGLAFFEFIFRISKTTFLCFLPSSTPCSRNLIANFYKLIPRTNRRVRTGREAVIF